MAITICFTCASNGISADIVLVRKADADPTSSDPTSPVALVQNPRFLLDLSLIPPNGKAQGEGRGGVDICTLVGVRTGKTWLQPVGFVRQIGSGCRWAQSAVGVLFFARWSDLRYTLATTRRYHYYSSKYSFSMHIAFWATGSNGWFAALLADGSNRPRCFGRVTRR